ncbi:MICAL-like protein isoform X1 [Megachile rotundata]|uniref:MICAL-like protein isoform X1 n=3 Tax=Megachile rotundata TaxID=143995 RepID=UPI003FD418DD
MGERRGTKALELWCRRITEGYPGVNVQNMTTSWKDGLAFCAMIHHFRPDLIDFNSLDKDNVYENNELAFKIAEQHLGIPALLDAEDMASCSVPDRLSILTYLSQFYQTFGGSSPSRLAVNRTTETTEEKIAPIPESPKEKAALGQGMRRDPCAVCGLPVFLAEKLVLGHVAYHRTCFRCARCNNQLTLGNYYETEKGQYCCETCPDEEPPSPTMQNYSDIPNGNQPDEVVESFGNEENANAQTFDSRTRKLEPDDFSVPDIIAQTSRLRLNFMSNHLLSSQDTASGVDSKSWINDQHRTERRTPVSERLEFQSRRNKDSFHDERSSANVASAQLRSHFKSNGSSLDDEDSNEEMNRNFTKKYSTYEEIVDSDEEVSAASSNEIIKDKFVNSLTEINTADEPVTDKSDDGQKHSDTENCHSLVQARLRLFENAKDNSGKREDQRTEISRRKAQYKEHKVQRKDSKGLDTAGVEKLAGEVKAESSLVTAVSEPPDVTSSNKPTSSKISEPIANQMNISEDITDNSDKQTENPIIDFPKLHLQMKPTDKGSNENLVSAVASETDSVKPSSTVTEEDYPEDLNPFKSDEEENSDVNSITSPLQAAKNSTNPFESEEALEEELQQKKEQLVIPKPATRNNVDPTIKSQSQEEISTKIRLIAPQINLNPFWSDDDDPESDSECKAKVQEAKPVPKPRTTRNIHETGVSGLKSDQNHSSLNISSSSLETASTSGTTCRKKKQAPLPPNRKDHSLPNLPLTSSPNVICKTRKIKPAPPPPIQTSSPCNTSIDPVLSCDESPICNSRNASRRNNVWEDEKISKDAANRNRQSFTHTPCKEGLSDKSFIDKSTEGKWKRKKGPAPPCPMPLKRKIKVMSLKDVKLELDEIELQQQGLEKQGVRLEQLIRSKCESDSKPDDVSLGTDVEELVLELFALVNEKNELFRRQAELMLLRRQQRLEEEHVEVEYQIRCLMSQQESMKTDFDKQREEALIKRLVEIVERRNEIVDCLEMDRRREIEEDKSIHKHMDLFAVKNKNEILNKESNHVPKSKQKESKSSKSKEKKLKKILKKDIDKDIDEIEFKLKRHNKRKWF